MPKMKKEFTMYFDGASKGNPGPAGIGAVVTDHAGKIHELKKYIGTATNNQAEYSALLEGLRCCASHGATEVNVYGDSELVIRQLNGEYQVKDPKLRILYDEVIEVRVSFDRITFRHIPREKN